MAISGDGDACVIVFARAPLLGTVKTRLAAALGDDAALCLYRAMLADTCAAVAAAGVARRVLCVAGDPRHPELLHLMRTHQMEAMAQGDGDLGARLAAACDRAWARGARRVCVVGSDAPLLDAARLRAALAALETHALVLGPAGDGGYYLVGLARPLPIFDGIAWSTPRVLAETLARVAPGEAALLPPLDDVDEVADVERLRALLPRLGDEVAPATRAALAQIQAQTTAGGVARP